MASGLLLSSLFLILLSSLSSASKRVIQNSRLSQPQEFVSVTTGEVLHLVCEVYDSHQPGSVKWFLGEGPQQKLIYANDETYEKDERITRDSPGSNMDFSISIHNVTLEDAGTYRCLKEKKSWSGSMQRVEESGTQVVVKGSQRKSTYGLYLGLFLNKVAMALLLRPFPNEATQRLPCKILC